MSDVSVGYGAPMDSGGYESNVERERRKREERRAQNPDAWAYREEGLPAFLQSIPDVAWGFQDFLDQNLNPGRWFSGQAQIGAQSPALPETASGSPVMDGPPNYTNAPAQPEETWADFLASFGGSGSGSGAARPDFSSYRAALTEQAGGLNAQIQAMYNALGEEAGANVGRIQDIYGGAGEGIGNVYDSATSNVADAFSSSQQQAADQMARLGIEAAAPAVIDPMALSQAEAVSGLEQGRASGQAAVERYGASASGFGSQMAQVAQQQGTEMNSAILASLQNRLAESLAAEQTGGGGGGGGGGMSVRDQLALREAFESRGQVPLDERKFAFQQAEAILRNSRSDEESFLKLTTPRRQGEEPLMTEEEAEAAITYARETFAPNFGPSF